MKNWHLTDTDGPLREVVRQALCCGPQRLTLEGKGEVVVLSPAEYERLAEAPAATGAEPPADQDARTGQSLMDFMQASPLAEAIRSGDWRWEWDDETRSWVERAA